MQSIKQQFEEFITNSQRNLCLAIENLEPYERFNTDNWQRHGGGGGVTRIIQNGKIWEKGGVNTSIVFGEVTPQMEKQLGINGTYWYASGISSVLHPVNPFVPTVHFNFRYFELYNQENSIIDSWFGGGVDITPYYLFEEDIIHFHTTYKNILDSFDKTLYSKFKHECDNYFVNKHRNNERRGLGGIFYDKQYPSEKINASDWIKIAKECCNALPVSYLSIVKNRCNTPYNESNKYWQQLRRGRYIEFNLLHDKGTLFGLHSNGRVESIMMSLPPQARFDYKIDPQIDSEEYKILQYFLTPKDWIN